MHESIIITPSKQAPKYPFTKLLPTDCVGSPPKVDNGIGAIAVYKYILKNLPYTVSIIINESIVINSPPY